MGESIRSSNRSSLSRRVGFWLGLGAFALMVVFGNLDPGNEAVGRMAAIALLMAIWWITDAIPLPATSLLPILLFPVMGIMSGKEVAPVYVNYIIFLYIGGFLIALAMERWNLHRRIALNIIGFVGSKPSRLVMGFMIATALLSMWISNTATTIMMLAIGLAVIRQAEDSFGKEEIGKLSVALLLGIAYSASIGGISTLVGTPPNLALVRLFDQSFPEAATAGYHITFGQWMMFGVPLSFVMLVIVWLILTQVIFRVSDRLTLPSEVIRDEKRKLGPVTRQEICVASVFAMTALLWIFRADINLGDYVIRGWSTLSWIPFGNLIDDGTIAVGMALILFLIPAGKNSKVDGDHRSLLDVSVFAKIPWGIILLFGGGFALAKGFQTSGLSDWIGNHFSSLEGSPTWVLVALISTGITFLTELTSNTATTEMILPILASIATAAKMHPLLLMVPAAVAASCAFMMPVATPPNAIVFGSGRITIAQMVKAGIIINLIGVVVITGLFLLLGPMVFQIDPDSLPDWVTSTPPPVPSSTN